MNTLRRYRTPLGWLMICLMIMSLPSNFARAENWVPVTAGPHDWTNAANWSPASVPNGIDAIAILRPDLTANQIINLGTGVPANLTVGTLSLGDLLGTSTLVIAPGVAGSSLTFDVSSGNAALNKYASATDTFQAPLVLNDDLDANIFAGTFDLNGAANAPVSFTGSGNLLKNGAGALRLNLNTTGGTGYTGDWVVNFGTLNIGGVNGATPTSLGTGTGGIILNGTGRADLAAFSLNNNGSGVDGFATYAGNSNVNVRGGATINVAVNYIGGTNDRVTHVLNDLNFGGGVLRVTAANSHMLRFDGTTTLSGQTNVFDVLANTISTQANITLQGPVTGSNGIVKEGVGRLKLTSAGNDYTGPTAVKNGVLELGSGSRAGTGVTYVNGGTLSIPNAATLNEVTANGLVMVGQLGTSRLALPVLGYNGFINVDSTNPLDFNVPIAGAILGIDGINGTSSINTANIDLAYVAGGNERVWLGNVPGFDRTYQGVLSNSANAGMGTLRITAGSNTFVIAPDSNGNGNQLGGAGAMNDLVFGFDHQNPIAFAAATVANAASGTISIRSDNSAGLGSVTVNRGVTVNINGSIFTPLGAGPVAVHGGTLNTDNTSAAQFGNTNFKLFSGGTLLLDNSNVVTNNTNRRLQIGSDIALTSSVFRLIGDGGTATTSSQTVNSISFAGGSTLSIDTDGTTAGRLTSLTTGSLDRVGTGTLNLRSLSGQTTTFGTAVGTQKLIVTNAPIVTNGMMGAHVALWGGTTANDQSQPLFATYDPTHGVQAATFTHTNTLTGTGTGSIVSYDTTAYTGAGASVQALRIRSTASGNTFNATSAMTIGAAAGVGQGAGLYFAHTSNDTVTHTSAFNFGSQEGIVYAATSGGTSGVINLSGILSGSAGITRFGDGILTLSGNNNFTGPLTLNSGETRLNALAAAGGSDSAPGQINLYGGSLYLNSSNRFYANVSLFDNARVGNVNVASSAFNNLTIEPRIDSTAPVVFWHQAQAGGNITTAYGSLTMNGPGQLSLAHPFQVNGGISGTGTLEKYFNDRLIIAGDSSSYSGDITAYAGVLQSQISTSTAKPFGSGNTVTINPGAHIVLAAPSNIENGQVIVNSDHGGIATIGQMYVADPTTTLPSMTVNSTAPWKASFALGAFGFSIDLDQSTLFGGNTYLGGALGYTSTYTGNLTPSAQGFLLGGSQGTVRIANPLTGSANAIIGLSMVGAGNRGDQIVNNSGGVVQFDVPMTYTGDTILNPGTIFRISAKNALDATGDLILAGGQLRTDPASGQNRMIAPIVLSNNVIMTADTTIQVENSAYDFRIGGSLSLAPGSNGVVRALAIGNDQPGGAANNAGMVYLDGGITDGVGGSGNHFVKNGVGTLFFTGPNTYTGTTTIQQGLIGVNGDADWGQSTGSIVLPGGGLAVWENSFTTSRNYSVHGGNGWFDIGGGLTLTQDASSTIDGTSFIMKRGLGSLVLNGNNAQTGLWIGDGTLQVNSQASLGNGAEAGATAIQFGGDQALGGATVNTRYTGGTLAINFTGATNRGITFNNNANTTFSGGIHVMGGNNFTVNGIISQGTELDYAFLTGPGTLTTTGANTLRQFAVTNGTLQFSNNTPWTNSTATAADNTIIEMMGGTVRAFNTGANIALANGASTTTYNYGGGGHLRLGSGVGFSAELAADNLIRVNQGTLVLETEGATVLGGVGASNAGRLIVTNAINTGLARGSATTGGIFAAHLIGADSAGTAHFLENDAVTGFKAYSGVGTNTLAGLNPAGIGDITGAQSLSGLNSIYAFRTTADVSGGTLSIRAVDNVNSGGILFNGSNTISSNVIFDAASALAAGTGLAGEGLVYVKPGENAAISGNVTANAFTKFGRGSLTLSGNNLIAGEVSVQAGTLRLAGSSPLSVMNSELNINAGATLDLNGTRIAVETLGNNNRTVSAHNAQIGGSVTNSSGSLATLTMGGGVSSVFNGTLDLNLKLAKTGSSTLVLNGYSSSSPDSGKNTFTGGVDIYGTNAASIVSAATVNATATVTVPNTAGLVPGMMISGAGIPVGSYITTINSGTTFNISQNATATATVTLTSVGGLTVNNAPNALGGFNGAPTGDVNLYSGNLNLLFSNGNTGINGTQGQNYNNQIVKIGDQSTDGVTLNVRGPGTIYVNQGLTSSNGLFGQGNILQVGAMNVTNTTLTLGGGNLYRFRAAGPIAILGSQAAFQTSISDGPSGAIELMGLISGNGALTKLGDGTLRGIVIGNPGNTYSGGTNIVAGDVQVLPTTGTPLGTGPVRVFPDGSLRLAGIGSVDPSKLTVMSRVSALGAIVLDDNFDPSSILTAANFSSVYNNALQLGQPFFTRSLDMSTIGDGRAFLGGGLNAEVAYTGTSLGAGVPDTWNPGAGVYRIAPGASSFAFSGVDNVLTGTNYLQVGPQRVNVLGSGSVVNGSNILIIRNANDYTEGTQIVKGASIYIETGGRASGETALGSGDIEVYGELRVRGSQGSLWNAGTSAASNAINLRPGGVVRLHDADGAIALPFLGAGDQGRWGDNEGVDLNGGIFIYHGAGNLQSSETIGDVQARKSGQLQVFRNSTASSAQLNVGDISREERGVLGLVYNVNFLGLNTTTPRSFERILASSIEGAPVVRGGTTNNGAGVINGGILSPWIVDRTTNSFVGYNPTAANSGFQPLLSTATPGAGQIAYNQIATGTSFGTGIGVNDIVDFTTAAKVLNANPTMHALRMGAFNLSPTASFNTMTLNSGGLIMTGGTINPTGAITAGVVSPMTLNFGAAGAGEALIYNSGTAIIQAQINAAQGLTKFGAGQLQIHSINPGIGGPVTLHEGTTYIRVPYSGAGSGAPVGQVLDGQDIIVNGGTLNLQSYNANAAGTATEIASNVASAQGLLDSNIFIRGDSVMRANGAAQYVQIADLTIGNSAGSTAMSGNSTISLNLQSGIWVRGTTTLAPEARINSTFDGFAQSTLAGVVTGTGGFIKYGNGATTLLRGDNNYAGGTTIWGSTAGTAMSTVASGFRGAGTPFGSGDIQIQPGGLLRIADNANIAANAVTLRSDGAGLGGIGLAHNQVLDLGAFITSGTPAAGQIKIESTGPFAGVIGLDYGYYSKPLDMAAIPGGDWWLGNSQQIDSYYFNAALGASSGGKYLLGGGGSIGSIQFGSVLVSAARTSLFENVITGGSPNQVKVEIGAQTGDFAWNSPSFIGGNSSYVALTTRNMGLLGDTRVNTNTALGIGNNFALGSGRLVVNGGAVRFDIGNNNFITSSIVLNNDVVLQGDYNAVSGDVVLLGDVALSDVVGAGATRNLNISAGTTVMRGVVSGAVGSNLLKIGAGNLFLGGQNTYEGFTQANGGTTFFAGNVLPNAAGPFGVSDSPVIMGGGNLRAVGRLDFARDLIVNTSGILDTSTHNRVLVLGGISVAAAQTLTVGAVAADVATFRGGVLELAGAISGAGALTIGTTAVAPAIGGTVSLSGNVNGYGINTYSGGTTIQSARVQLGGSTYFSGPANNPTAILSGPLGTGLITIAGGEANRGAIFEAVGGPVVIANGFNPINVGANTSMSFGGSQSLTFTRNLDLNNNAALFNRTFATQSLYQPVTFSGVLSATGAAGGSLVKTGPGKLILTGANTFGTSATTGVQINQGILQVNADAALGAGTSVRLNGGYLAASNSFSTARQVILQAASGVDVSAGQTLTLTAATSGAFALTKAGQGTLALNASANTITALSIGGVAQLNTVTGFSGAGGGVVSTTATTGTPFATTSATISGGALSLIGGVGAQALVIPTVNYGAGAMITLAQGATSSQLTATALTRQGAFNGLSFGTLTVAPSSLANLGGTERLLTSTAGLNTATGGGNILTTPSIFVRLQAAGSDANFARVDGATGVREHDVATVATLGTTAPANVANISTADVAGAGNIDVQAIRTTANIAPADGSTLLRLARGGLILNGNSGATISAPLLFGTGTGASLVEAIVYARENQLAVSALTGGTLARDFTKAGPGLLEIGGSNNLLNTNGVRLPVVSVQEGTLRFANNSSVFQNQFRGAGPNQTLGSFVLNVNENGVFDLNGLNLAASTLTGNGTILSNVPGLANLTLRNGTLSGSAGDTSTFTGRISDGAGTVSLTRSGNGILVLAGHGDHTGGTFVEAGRVLNGTGSAVGVTNARLEIQTVTALGNGPVHLQGGVLRLNAAALLGGAQNLSEVTNGLDYLMWGGPAGMDLRVSNTAFSNGVALPENRTSTLNAATQTAGIGNLTVDAPQLTFGEGTLQVNGVSTFSQANTILRLAGGTVYLSGKVNAAGNSLTKTGANTLVVSNGQTGVNQNEVGSWKVYGGVLQARASSGSANPLGINPLVEINGGSTNYGLQLLTDGDGTGFAERVTTYSDTRLRFGSMLPVSDPNFVPTGAGRVNVDRAFLANSSFKTVEVESLEVGGALGAPYMYFLMGNNDSLRVDGPTTFMRDMVMQIDGGQGLVLNGPITGNGSFVRRTNGGSLYINSDNSAGYDGGTFFVGSGRNYLGSLEGHQVTLSNTAKLGAGHVFVGPLAHFQINDAGNLVDGQNIYASSNLSWLANFSLAADLSLDQVRLRSQGLGGIENAASDYYLSASNPSSAVLSLGTVYTQALDLSRLGDGMWYLGSTTNGVGANGAYDAATLVPGLGNTYRLGAGGSTLFFGTNGNTNVLTDYGASSSLVIGAPMTVQSMAPVSNGVGGVVLLQNQDYTGSTLVNWQSTLDFRGTMKTSGFNVYGTLNVAGEAGTFIHPDSGANIPVTLRPGSLLRFDNTSAGVLPVTATEGRWQNSVGIDLRNGVLRLQGNAAVEVVEEVGEITAGEGGNRIEIVRGVTGRGTELRTPAITRAGSGTVQFIHNGSQLGSDERVIVTGTAPTVTNGMVAPWMFSATDVQFVTYNAANGFTLAGFDRNLGAATHTSLLNASTERAIVSGIQTLNGADVRAYAARIDADINLTTATAATDTTNRLILDSGGLLSNAARTIQTGIQAGATGTGELIIYNNNTLNVGILANNTTSGRITASGITKTGAGTLQILSEQPGFQGAIRIQQGALQFQYTATIASNITTQMGGGAVGGNNIHFDGNNVSLILRMGTDTWTVGNTATFNNNLVIGDHVSVATINVDRAGGSITTRRMAFNNLTFGQNEGDNGQVLRLVGTNAFGVQINGTTTLVGRSAIAVDNSYNGSAADAWLMGQVTGSGMLIKGPSDGRARNLFLQNVASLNNWSGGTVLQGGTLQIFAKAANVAANVNSNLTAGGLGTGDITLIQGTLDLRVDTAAVAADADIEFIRYASAGNGPNLTVNGSATLFADRTGLVAFDSNKMVSFNDLTIGSQILSTSGGNGYGFAFGGTTTLLGNAHFNNANELVLGGQAGASGTGSITTGGGQVLINKVGTGTLWIHSTNNALNAPLYINSGLLDWGNRVVGNNTATLGIADIFVNPGASARIRSVGNLNTASGQEMVLTSTPYSSALLRTIGAFTQAQLQSFIQPRETTSNEVNYVSFEGNLAAANLDQSTLLDGRVYFGAVGDRIYTGAATGSSLTPGLSNLPNAVVGGTSTNRVYRLGHNSANTLSINLTAVGAGLGDVGGPTDVQIGSLATLGTSNWNTGFVYFQDQNTYTGQTVVSRGLTLRFNTSMAAGDTAGPLGLAGGGAGPIDIYGSLRVENGGSLRNNAGTGQYYSNVRLHPGSLLTFYDIAAGNVSNRWHDTTAVELDGAGLQIEPLTNTNDNSERFGAISFDRGGRIFATSEGTGDAFLYASSITRAAASAGAGTGRGTMVFNPSASATLGAAATAGVAQQQIRFDTAPTASAVAGVAGMLPAYFIEGQEHRFVTHGVNGITRVADGSMVAMPAGAGTGTEVVNLTAAHTMGSFETSIFALRGGNITLNSPTGANNDATITFGGSGADIGGVISTAATFTINPNLKFGATGSNEALLYLGGTMQLNGNITAGGITKFGVGQLNVGNDQSDAARGIGQGYSNGWVINEGSLNLQQFGSAGNAVASNTIVLNANQQSTATLFLRAVAADSLVNYSYSSGKIIVVDNGVIDWDPAAEDRVHSIADLEIQQSGGIGNGPTNGTVDAQLRVAHNRSRSILAAGSLTISSNAILNVDSTAAVSLLAAYGTNTAYLTNGISSGMSVSQLIGSNRLTKWGDAYLYVRGASPSFSGAVVIDQGAVQVTHNQSLGSGPITVNRYGVLDIAVANFTPTNSSLTYNEGSVERWSVDGARSGAINLGKGTLQIAANQPTTSATITLDGGGIEAWLRSDDHIAGQYSGGVLRVLNANVSFNLAGNSFVGSRYYLGANGLDMGKQTHDNRPMEEHLASGAILDIKGIISGVGGLTKAGYDTVILSGQNTYDGDTFIEGGRLLLGADDALPTTTTVLTTSNGVLDLNGQDQTVGALSNPVATTNFNFTNGFITNGGTSDRTLTTGNGVTTDFSYGGIIQHNIALTKIGTATMRLTNNNTYRGLTTVNGGVLEVGGRLSGTMAVVLNTDGTLLLNSVSGENNIVNVLADVTLDGGTLAIDNSQSGKTNTFRGLTVASDSTINFGAGNADILRFNTLEDLTGNLSVRGWSGALYDYVNTLMDSLTATPTHDRLIFTGATGYATHSAINQIRFVDDNGITYARGWQTAFDGPGMGTSIVPVNLATAYWRGNLAGDAWNEGNWSSDLAGTQNPGIAPTGNTDVILGATNAVDQGQMVLGEDMQVKSITVNNSNPTVPVLLQSTGGYTLSIVAGNAITTDAGGPAATLETPIQFMSANATVAVNSSNPLTLNGAITATALTKTGTGLLVLNGNNTYTGGTQINGGTVRAGHANALGGSGPIDFGGGALQHSAGNTVDYSARIVNSSSAIRIDTNGQTVTYASPISATNTGGLSKEGAGTLILTAANNYIGSTTVDGGILLANNTTGSATGTGTVTVADGGTLGGTGTVAGNTTLALGGTLTGGTDGGVGTLTFSGDLTADSGSTWLVDFVTGSVDFVAVGGELNLNGLLEVIDDGTFVPYATYNIASYGAEGTSNFRFSNAFVDGAQVGSFYVNYGTVNAGHITLTAVPEPGTLGLLGLALAGFFSRRIRRRRAEAALVQSAGREE